MADNESIDPIASAAGFTPVWWTFVLLGIPLSLASAIALLTRLATYWFELILCALVSLRYGYKESLKEFLQ